MGPLEIFATQAAFLKSATVYSINTLGHCYKFTMKDDKSTEILKLLHFNDLC